MKRMVWFVLLGMLLGGCGAQPVYETVGDIWQSGAEPEVPASLNFALPDDASMEVLESLDSCKSYAIGNWVLYTQILEGGDVAQTMYALTGTDTAEPIFHPVGAYDCYESVCSVMEEEGEYVIRTAVIPKGAYHYCLSIKSPAAEARPMGAFFGKLLKNVSITDTAP